MAWPVAAVAWVVETAVVLPAEFPKEYVKVVQVDTASRLARFAPGIELPVRPFFGNIAVAPPPKLGRIGTHAPGIHGGNLDNKELTAGTTLFLPVMCRVPCSWLATGTPQKAMEKSVGRP